MVLVLKETEAEDLLAASSLTALLSPDMGGHLGMGRQIQDIYNLRKQIGNKRIFWLYGIWSLRFIIPPQKCCKQIVDCGFNFPFSPFPFS